jgi:hypothetical protein
MAEATELMAAALPVDARDVLDPNSLLKIKTVLAKMRRDAKALLQGCEGAVAAAFDAVTCREQRQQTKVECPTDLEFRLEEGPDHNVTISWCW